MMTFEDLMAGTSKIDEIVKTVKDMEPDGFVLIMCMVVEEYCYIHKQKANEMMHMMADCADAVFDECGAYEGGLYNG